MACDYMGMMGKEQSAVRRCADDFPDRRGIRVDDLRQRLSGGDAGVLGHQSVIQAGLAGTDIQQLVILEDAPGRGGSGA